MRNIITIDDRIDLAVEDAKLEVLRLRHTVDTLFEALSDDDHANFEALNAFLAGLDAAFDALDEVEDREFIF